jgi:hypothetical protein
LDSQPTSRWLPVILDYFIFAQDADVTMCRILLCQILADVRGITKKDIDTNLKILTDYQENRASLDDVARFKQTLNLWLIIITDPRKEYFVRLEPVIIVIKRLYAISNALEQSKAEKFSTSQQSFFAASASASSDIIQLARANL